MLLRVIRYCSIFQTYLNERESLRIAFLLNKYLDIFINEQFNRVWSKFNINETVNVYNYDQLRQQIIQYPQKDKESIEYNKHIFIHFTYCLNIKQFPKRFHDLWNRFFSESPIADVRPILGIRNVNNLQQRLIHTRKL